METLVVVAHQRDQYCGNRSKPYSPGRFGFSTSRGFRGINCRNFNSGTGILPPTLNSHATPVTKKACASSPSTQLFPSNSNSDDEIQVKSDAKTAPIPINCKICPTEGAFGDDIPTGSLSFSELWAGPAYSNSPPPSSLPIPKFSIQTKRSVSLDWPSLEAEIEMCQVAKSAPSSPLREHVYSAGDIFFGADFATKTLCRLLNLNIEDEGGLRRIGLP